MKEQNILKNITFLEPNFRIYSMSEVHCSKHCYPFVSLSAKFGNCTSAGLNGQLVEAKIRTYKCPKFLL
jgi:hypothetical protein